MNSFLKKNLHRWSSSARAALKIPETASPTTTPTIAPLSPSISPSDVTRRHSSQS